MKLQPYDYAAASVIIEEAGGKIGQMDGRGITLDVPCSILAGALLVVLADILSRMVNPPFETPTGAITALVGVPFFVYLARRKGSRV